MNEGTAARPRSRTRSLALIGALSVLLAQFVVWAGPASPQVSATVMYGHEANFDEDSRELYRIDPATGVRMETIGITGFEITGLAVDPTTGQLYGATSTGDEQVGPGALVRINKSTAATTFVGYIFMNCDSPVQDITFTTTGQLFGYTRDCGGGDRLVQINKTTGRGTPLGPAGSPADEGGGLAADPDDNTLWLTADEGDADYGTVDPTTGVYTSQGTLDGVGNYGDGVNALSWSCDGETLYANIRDGFFATIDTATDHLTEVGRTGEDQDAIAVDCSPPQPVVQCKGKAATVVGTSGKDDLTGTSGKDVIAGRGGNDSISALGGNDTVCGEGGKDKANGGGGNDRLHGQAGNDRLKGAGGKDNLKGGGGNDRCTGGPGTDKGNCESESSIP
jgi:RTX calcium-binding nonapeptide repeat (4 copies)